ncbi:MAG: hypothetical protein ACE5EY_13325, partial [Anaerolineae bacterium]
MKRPNFILHPSSFIFLLALLVACAAAPPTASEPPDIPVAEPFQAFYQERGGRAVFGDVLEPAFPALDDGRLLQYFENLRLEQDPESGEIVVSPLGAEIVPETFELIDAEDADAIASAFDQFYADHAGG